MTLGRCPVSILCSRGTPDTNLSQSICVNSADDDILEHSVLEREFFIDNLLVQIHHII